MNKFSLQLLDGYKIHFLNQLLEQQNVGDIDIIGFLAQVHAPTVTMPRIKAITTGSIPGFVDVLLNFGSKDLGKNSFGKIDIIRFRNKIV